MTERLLTMREVAAVLGYKSLSSVRARIKEGKIKPIYLTPKTPRFNLDQLRDFDGKVKGNRPERDWNFR